MLRAVLFGNVVSRRLGLLAGALCLLAWPAFAGQVADLSRDGVGITVDADPETVDVGRDFFVTVTVTSPAGKNAFLPDLRDRLQGFQVAEDFAEEPVKDADGRTVSVTRWRLVPEPLAKRYRLAPLVVTVADAAASGETAPAMSFYTAPVPFAPPAARAPEKGEMEIAPTRDLPPLSWKLVGIVAAVLAGLAALTAIVCLIVRKIRLMVKIHRMSPIERALYELDVLLKKGLPGRGFYKDFYVELTMVVRRYIERRHDVRAPNLTTQEFLDAAKDNPAFTAEAVAELKSFLESSDMVKFAGVEATPEMADTATSRARIYLTTDAETPRQKAEH